MRGATGRGRQQPDDGEPRLTWTPPVETEKRNQNQETKAERELHDENLPNNLPGTGGPGISRQATPELIPQIPEQMLLPPALEPERPGNPTHQPERLTRNNGSATEPDLELRATIDKNSAPTEKATHRGGRVRKPPAYLRDYICE